MGPDETAALQYGLATVAQLTSLGVTRAELRAHVRRGAWRRVRPHVTGRPDYVVGQVTRALALPFSVETTRKRPS